MDFSEAKTYLQKSENGPSMYDHITNLILKLVTERPNHSVALFEHISTVVKQRQYAPDNGLDGGKFGKNAAKQDADAICLKYTTQSAKNFQIESTDSQDTDLGFVQDMMTDMDWLRWCGVSFGDVENFRIYVSMKNWAAKLLDNGDLQSMRFWGKILGTEKDYYILEGKYRAADFDEPEDSKDLEISVMGPNAKWYWVCNTLCDEWIQLPMVKASQMLAARQIKRFFTGNLDAPVKGHPPFPGTEREYLRAQIALISSECAIAPQGYFKPADDEFIMVQNEEMEPLALDDLKQPDAWQVTELEVNEEGRCVPFPTTDDDGNQVEPENPTMLRSIRDDEWTIQSPMPNKVCLRSRKWPGAHSTGFGSHFCWIYVGYAQPVGIESEIGGILMYTPKPPGPPQQEFDDSEIFEEKDKLEDPTPPEGDNDDDD